jgi:malate synthase
MEDAATAEISRAQVWQWIRHPKGILEDGRKVTLVLVDTLIKEELEKIKTDHGPENFNNGRFQEAKELFERLVKEDVFAEFLTVPGYDYLT